MQIVHKVLTSTLCHQQPIKSAAWNNHTLISLTVSYNVINLSEVLIATKDKSYLVKWRFK